MILCFDFGNTIKKYAFVEEQKIVLLGQLSSFNKEEIATLLENKIIKKIILCSVIKIPASFMQLLGDIAPVERLTDEDLTKFFLQSTYDFSTLGMDRKLLSIGAMACYPKKHLLVIALGTCITYQIITNIGQFDGGVISPGLDMRARAMHAFTDKLPHVDWRNMNLPKGFGNNTSANLFHGVVSAARIEMEGFMELFYTKFPDGQVVLTGGDGVFMQQQMQDKQILYNENLVWMGMISVDSKKE